MDSKPISDPIPEFGEFFLAGEGSDSAFRVKMSCQYEEMEAFTRGETLPTEPVECHWYMGRRKPADIVFAGSVVAMIVSERVVDVLRHNSLTGWSTYPVRIIGRDRATIEGYRGMAITGRCGPEDKSRRLHFKKQMPGRESNYWRGLYFDPLRWDGSDLFMFADRHGLVVRSNVVDAFRRAKITNMVFERLTEVEQMAMPGT